MNEKLENSFTKYDGIYYLKLFLRYKYFIIVFVILFTAASIFLTLRMPNWYSSTINVVPAKTSGTGLEGSVGSISSALKDFGMTKLGGKSDGAYSYYVFLTSRTVKDSMIKKYELAKEYDIHVNKMAALRKAFEENLDISVETEGNFNITIYDRDPQKAALMANDYILIANSVSVGVFQKEAQVNSEFLEKRVAGVELTLKLISDSLEKYSGKKYIFSPQDQARSLSTALVELKAEVMKQEIVYDMLKNKYGENDPTTQMQKNLLHGLQSQLNSAKTEPGFGGNFTLKQATEVGIEFMRLYAQFEAFSKLKIFLLPMLEEARFNERRQTQALFVVDKAIPADTKSKPKRSIIVLGTFAGSFFISILLILIINSLSILRQKTRE